MESPPTSISPIRRKFLGALTSGFGFATVGSHSGTAATLQSRSTKTIRAGTAEETKVYTYDSGVAGPTMFVIGGVHGDEIAGYLAADEIATWSVSAGRLVVIPRANVPAIKDGTRYGLTGDLNRQFPLLQQPSSTLAKALWNQVMLAGPDLFVDLHEARKLYTAGGLAQSLGYYPVQNVRDMAGAAITAVNQTISNSAYRFYRRMVPGPLEAPQGSFIKRMLNEVAGPAYITETYRELPRLDRIAQQKRLVRTLLNERIQTFTTQPGWNRIQVRGSGSAVNYEFTVSGRIRKRSNTRVESADLVLGNQAFGTVTSSDWDTYEYTGSLKAFAVLSGSASNVAVYVNGTRRSLSDLELANSNEIRVVGNGTRTDYEFSVSGSVVKSRALPVSANDIVWDGRVSGYVVDSGDTYRYTGNVNAFSVTGGSPSNITVRVNGTARSIPSLNPSTTRSITLERTSSDVEYQFAVSGTVVKRRPNANDRVHGRRALGTVGANGDGYQFTGDITAFAVTAGSPNNLAIYVDGSRRSLSSFPSHPSA